MIARFTSRGDLRGLAKLQKAVGIPQWSQDDGNIEEWTVSPFFFLQKILEVVLRCKINDDYK